MVVAIKMIGIFLGVLARSLAPYLRKLREGKIKGFHRRHLVSSIGSLVFGIIITLLIFPQFQAAAPNGGFEVYIKLFVLPSGSALVGIRSFRKPLRGRVLSKVKIHDTCNMFF